MQIRINKGLSGSKDNPIRQRRDYAGNFSGGGFQFAAKLEGELPPYSFQWDVYQNTAKGGPRVKYQMFGGSAQVGSVSFSASEDDIVFEVWLRFQGELYHTTVYVKGYIGTIPEPVPIPEPEPIPEPIPEPEPEPEPEPDEHLHSLLLLPQSVVDELSFGPVEHRILIRVRKP